MTRRAEKGRQMIATQGAARRRRELIDGVYMLGFSVLSLIFLVPVVVLIVTGLRSEPDFLQHGVFSIPTGIRVANLTDAWTIGDFSTTYRNSALITLVKVPLGLLISALAAYPLAKMRYPLRDTFFTFFVVGLAVPVQLALLPIFILDRHLGLLGTLWAVLPPYVAFGIPFQVFVLRGFMRLIPGELMEAARVDGANEVTIFVRVMLPLITPALATLCIIDATATWNEFMVALVMLPSQAIHTIPLGLLNYFNEYTGSYTLLSAGIAIVVAPLLLVYIFLQRFLVSGLVGGAVKT